MIKVNVVPVKESDKIYTQYIAPEHIVRIWAPPEQMDDTRIKTFVQLTTGSFWLADDAEKLARARARMMKHPGIASADDKVVFNDPKSQAKE